MNDDSLLGNDVDQDPHTEKKALNDAIISDKEDGFSDDEATPSTKDTVPSIPTLSLKCRKPGCKMYDTEFRCTSELSKHET